MLLPSNLKAFRKANGRRILSNREIEVFISLGNGEMCKEIAQRLQLKRKTVEGYIEILRTKLNINNLHRLTWLATRWSCGMPVKVQIVSAKNTT
jgi:DNA-binding NarL/FixJ family response regulator